MTSLNGVSTLSDVYNTVVTVLSSYPRLGIYWLQHDNEYSGMELLTVR